MQEKSGATYGRQYEHEIPQSPLPSPPKDCFSTSLEHVLAELEKIRLLLRIQLCRRKDSARNLSEEKPKAPNPDQLKRHLVEWSASVSARKSESLRRGVRLRLHELQTSFGLTGFELQCLLICLVSELDLGYGRLFAHLQDDTTRKYPSVDLVLNLLCRSSVEKLRQRERFSPRAPLIRRHLLMAGDDPAYPAGTLLSRHLSVEERITRYLLDSDEIDSRLTFCTACIKPQRCLEELVLSAEMKSKLSILASQTVPTESQIAVYLQGGYGSGRKSTAEALCREWHLGLLVIDLEALLSRPHPDASSALELALRESVLRKDALYLKGFDSLLAEDKGSARKAFLNQLRHHRGVTFLAGESPWQPRDEVEPLGFLKIAFPRPDYHSRCTLWQRALEITDQSDLDVPMLANQFRLTGGEIFDAVNTARQIARWRAPDRVEILSSDLNEACRLHSSAKLSTLGRKVESNHSWNDIVLPDDRVQQLREICNALKYRTRVLEDWGFERKISLGKGLNVLFAGPSGTGKTMAAGIMSGELGLDLYKIDLSTVVSKYIGETEKNLARIFFEAENSNVILFFDEADALFGKRSEVRDSHDRYANIEINYLLQKMEEHQGMVILATNFRKNMDDAFVRRMHFTVEFPLPSEADRRRIWEQVWPRETPQADDLDFAFMAKRFDIPGGNIRNIAMAAAFLAASNGGVVNMGHVLQGTRREYQKMGKVVTQPEVR